jgi:hypothetical protein
MEPLAVAHRTIHGAANEMMFHSAANEYMVRAEATACSTMMPGQVCTAP